MANRDPTSYTLYTENGAGGWTLYGVYTLQPVALQDLEELLLSSRVQIEYTYPNGVIVSRFIESAVAPTGLTTSSLSPSPSPTPTPPPPPPPPPPPGAPSLDFSDETNSMYIGAI